MDNELKNVFRDEKAMMKERLRKEWDTLKAMKGAERRQHIAAYYKFHIVFLAVVFLLVGSGIYRLANPPKEAVLTIAWVGLAEYAAESQLRELETALTLALVENPNRQTIRIIPFLISGMPEMDVSTQNRLAAMAGLSEIDAFVGTFAEGWYGEFIMSMTPFWMFGDIGPILEQAGITGRQLIYFEEDEGTPLPRAVFLNDSERLAEMGIWTQNLYFAVMANTHKGDVAAKVLGYILRNP
jgi:hypothetical protein